MNQRPRKYHTSDGQASLSSGQVADMAEVDIESRDRGMALLRKYASLDAFQDHLGDEPTSDDVSEANQGILERITAWLRDEEKRRKVLWIDNSQLSANTTSPVPQSPWTADDIEEICRAGDIFGASFSFSRLNAAATTIDNDDALKARMSLFPTLAYQLAITMAHVEQHIIAAVALRDPAVFTRSLLSQLTELIVKPILLSTGPSHSDSPPKVIIIEGLGSVEGSDEAGTKEIIDSISQCLRGLGIPIGFILVRPPSGRMKLPRRYARVTRELKK